MNESLNKAIQTRLSEAKSVLVASHIRPDGDAVGALLGFGLSLQQAGKKVQMVLADGVPSSFRHLEGANQIKTKIDEAFDAFVTLDCADFKRTGRPFESIGQPDVNIDHHITNEKFAKLNLVEGDEVATSAVLTNHLPVWGYQITKSVAAALLTGIITDTLGFRTSNVTPEAMRQVATLMETGVDMPELYMRGLVRRSYEATRYWGGGLSNLQRKDSVVWSTLTLDDRRIAGYSGNDDADLINIISAIDNFKVGLIFVEQNDHRVKVSWRALETGIDVSPLAVQFGGGGHAAAAGADVEGTLDEVRDAVLKATYQALRP